MSAKGRPTPGFLKLFLCGHLYVCVCLPTRLLITSGVICHDIKPIYMFYMAALVSIISISYDLQLKLVIETNLIRVTQHCVSHRFTLTIILNICI